ncbi:MAG: ABC transporter ATP-binding protein [Planctomycetota bacterium]|jgi:phospholipid/cholesterol/gamma-HCH transport system ATP-binding protein|nr:MAG: ABC transporter ATP-binding protein [Planctomycetota bacterium]
MGNVIEIRNLVRRFGPQTVLNGINLDIAEGETMVIMGGSGCGKSTLLRHLIGSLQPSEGSIKILGEEIATVDEAGLDAVRKKFGILFQSGALFNSMSIADNIALPLREHTTLDSHIIEIQVMIKLELVGLREHANKFPSQISGGMKKRAGLARALALDPKILFYDEPSAGLDPVTSAEIDQLMLDLTRKLGVTSVVVTHEMDSAFTIADRMTMLDKGIALMIDTREAFDNLRKASAEEAKTMPEKDRLIRQFLRGDAQGPLTERKAATNYAEELLNLGENNQMKTPAISPNR